MTDERPRCPDFVHTDAQVQIDTLNAMIVRVMGLERELRQALDVARHVCDRILTLEAQLRAAALDRPVGSA